MMNARRRLFTVGVVLLIIATVPVLVVSQSGAENTGTINHTTADDFDQGTTDNLTVDNDSLRLSQVEVDGSTVTRPTDNSDIETSLQRGIRINANDDLTGVTFDVSSNTAGHSKAYLLDDGNNILKEVSLSAGQSQVTIYHELAANEGYRIALDGDGSEWTAGYSDSPTFPYESDDIDITHGYYDGDLRNTAAYGITSVSAIKDEGTTAASYTSDPIVVEDPTEGYVDLEIDNMSGSIVWQGDNSGSWVTIDESSTTTSGEGTVDLSPYDYTEYRVQVDLQKQDGVETWDATIHEDGVRFTNHAPSVDNSSASPAGSLETDTPVELSIDVDDAQFGSSQGDEVTVTFYNADTDNAIGTETVTESGTASIEWDSVRSGTNEWYAVAEDGNGGETQSSTFTFSTPGELFIYNENSPTDLVSNAEVDIQFYFEGEGGELATRNTSNGTINMEGLPPDTPFVVVAEADGYHPRRIYVESLFESQEIYLLPESEDYVDLTFVLDDFTGEFPQETTVLTIERELNGNWRTVQGDFFGGTGQFTAQLDHNTRHRMTLINTATGETRRIGTLTPTTSGTQPIEVTSGGDIELEGMNPSISVSPSTRSLAAVNNSSVSVAASGGRQQIDTWSVTVTYENDSGTVVLHDETTTSGPGTVTPIFDLHERDGGDVTVDTEIVLDSGEVITDSVRFGVREHFDHDYSLLSTLSRFEGRIGGGGATTFLAVMVTVVVTGMVAGHAQVSSEVLGGVAVGCLAGFVIIGWVGVEILFTGAITWVAAFGLRRGI